jgi:hypothetical protein
MSDDTERDERASEDETDREHEPAAARSASAEARRRRWLRIGVFVAFLGVAGIFVLPRVPHDQRVRVHLGPGSSRVVRVTARVSRDGVLDRETTFRFDHGAPPAFEWEFELPNGKADVELELATASGLAEQKSSVELRGEETTVEAADAMHAFP